jgi:hypothetical protein
VLILITAVVGAAVALKLALTVQASVMAAVVYVPPFRVPPQPATEDM